MDLAQDNSDRIGHAAEGDAAALTLLLHESRRRLCEYVARRIPRALCGLLDPDDVVQEAHVAAFRSIRTFTPHRPDAFFRWLATIAVHKLRDATKLQRAVKRGGGRPPPMPGGWNADDSLLALLDRLSAPGRTPSRTAARREAVQAVQAALAGLPADQRQVVWLLYIQGRSAAEAARALDRTEPAIRGLCRRGLAALREQLGHASGFISSAS